MSIDTQSAHNGPSAADDPVQVADRVMAKLLIVKSIVEDGYTKADFAGIKPQEIEAGYAQAYRLIDAGQAEQAEALLEWLCQLDHYQSKLFMALGVARQMQRKYDRALDAYGVAALHDADNPHVPMRAAECFMATQRYREAANAAEGCIVLCGQLAEFTNVRKRAETVLGSSHRKLGVLQ